MQALAHSGAPRLFLGTAPAGREPLRVRARRHPGALSCRAVPPGVPCITCRRPLPPLPDLDVDPDALGDVVIGPDTVPLVEVAQHFARSVEPSRNERAGLSMLGLCPTCGRALD